MPSKIDDALLEMQVGMNGMERRIRRNELVEIPVGSSHVSSVVKLAANTLAGATSCVLDSVPPDAAVNGGWLVIDVPTADAEVRKVTGISGTTFSWSGGLTYTHQSGDVVYWITEPILNVKWWGAIGNGSTSDHTALTRWLAQAFTGCDLHIGDGSYVTTGDLTLSASNCRLFGKGTLLISGSVSNVDMLDVTGNDCLVDGLIIDQSGVTTNSANGRGLALSGARCTARNVKITGEGSAGGGTSNTFYISGDNFLIDDCRSISAGYAGFRLQAANGMVKNSIAENYQVRALTYNGSGDWFILDGFEGTTNVTYSTAVGGLTIDPGVGESLTNCALRGVIISGTNDVCIKLDLVDKTTISDCHLLGTDPRYALFTVACESVEVVNCVATTRITINDDTVSTHIVNLHSDLTGATRGGANNIDHQGGDITVLGAKFIAATSDAIRVEDGPAAGTQTVFVDDVLLDGASGTVNMFAPADTLWPGRVQIGRYKIITGASGVGNHLTGTHNNDAYIQIGGSIHHREFTNDNDPATDGINGTWRVGDIMWEHTPSSGNPPGWMCTAAGTASTTGTWVAMANLA